MKALLPILILSTLLCVGCRQTPAVPPDRIAGPEQLDSTHDSNSTSISNAVKVASGLRVGMTQEEVAKYMQDHGMTQTNIYSISLDRGRTLTCPYPLAGVGASLVLEMECSQPPASGLVGWKNPLLKRAYIQGQGTNIIPITWTNAP